MVFSTIIFLCIFLPVVILGYYLVPKQGKNLFLLICSLFFYAWGEPVYVLIMLASIIYNYLFGLAIANRKKAKPYLVLAVLVNLGVLCVFKYSGFLVENIDRIIPNLLKVPDIALPIGISFYTFQGLSYCIDVYRDKKLVQKNPVNLALYIAMFPQLIAGPIVRYSDIRKELSERKHTSELFAMGAERFIIGLSKKAILANTVGALATSIMSNDMQYMSMPVAWVGAIAYALQIYFDFSGYSDMAIGLGRMFGFHFLENFDFPYVSKSITEFWRRWHISLGSWFREYVYIPLGGNRKGKLRQVMNLLIVWMLTGLWHGASWNFVLWGLYYGLLLILEKLFLSKIMERLSGVLKHIYSLFLILLGWMIFAQTDMSRLGVYLKAMFGVGVELVNSDFWYFLSCNGVLLVILVLCSMNVWKRIPQKMLGVCKPVLMVLFMALSFAFLVGDSYNPFLYFRF